MAELKGREKQIIDERIKKIEALKNEGINPYPQKFDKKNSCSECATSKIGSKIKTAGRLMNYRDLGKISFGSLRDFSGDVQIVLQEGETSDYFRKFMKKYVDAGDFVGVEGKIIKTKTGQISILVSKAELLTKGILPLPDKWHGLQDKEERYRKRYLDLIMNPNVKKVFETRAIVVDALRDFLKNEGFLEVETPTLQTVYGGASSTPFVTHLNALDIDMYMSISPELYLKRLVVGGMERVFTICKNFRNEGIDAFHNPEFTMMEYYAAYQTYEYHIKFAEKFFEIIKKKLKLGDSIEYQGKKISLKTPFKRVKFRDLLVKELGIDIDDEDTFDKLKKSIEKNKIKGIDISACKHYGALLDELYKRTVRTSIIQPTFLTHYPAEMIALAKRNEEDSRKINSVQLLINGAEVLKAYDELNDPLDQEERLREQSELLKRGSDDAMPMDDDFVNALKIGMPPTAGYGMGIDRIVMLLTNSPSIRDVILFPFMKPEGKEDEKSGDSSK
jgi:lysyl-tRNA synthetase, class II